MRNPFGSKPPKWGQQVKNAIEIFKPPPETKIEEPPPQEVQIVPNRWLGGDSIALAPNGLEVLIDDEGQWEGYALYRQSEVDALEAMPPQGDYRAYFRRVKARHGGNVEISLKELIYIFSLSNYLIKRFSTTEEIINAPSLWVDDFLPDLAMKCALESNNTEMREKLMSIPGAWYVSEGVEHGSI